LLVNQRRLNGQKMWHLLIMKICQQSSLGGFRVCVACPEAAKAAKHQWL